MRPRLRTTLRAASAVLVLAALAGAAWFLLVRDSDDEGAGEPARPAGVSARAEQVARGLVRSEQVDQVLLFGFAGTAVPRELSSRELGGVLVTGENGTVSEIAAALETAGKGRRIPPLLVAAHEGGIYRSFGDLPPDDRAIDIGDRASPEGAERWAFATAAALTSVGIDLNLFPVADVATLDSPVGGRAFSDDAALTAELTAAALRGCGRARLACAPLHFPGLGAASQDPAEGPATVALDPASLEARDLLPFRAAVAERTPAVVLSVALYTAYDAVTPAALVPEIAGGLLRRELGFKGVAITDDLGAGAVKATYAVPDAAVAALKAGADLVQVAAPQDQRGVRAAILAAVESGELPAERVKEAASRVLELKRRLGLLPTPP